MRKRRNNNGGFTALVMVGLFLLALVPATAPAEEGKVNINSATEAQLALLPRVGEVVAERILEFRDKNGRFKAPEDLMLVKGIGEKTFELIQPYVSVSGETTLTEKVTGSTEV